MRKLRLFSKARNIELALLLAVALVVLFVYSRTAASVPANALLTAQLYLAQVETGNYRAAYSMVAPEARPNFSYPEMTDIVRLNRLHYGRIVSMGPPVCSRTTVYDVQAVRLDYPTHAQKGVFSRPITIVVGYHYGRWQVFGCYYPVG